MMIFLVLTRRAIADLSLQPVNGRMIAWVNPGVLEDEEVAQMEAGGIEVVLLPRAVDPLAPADIREVTEEIRRTHEGTIWVEQPPGEPAVPSQAREPEDAPLRQVLPGLSARAGTAASWAMRQIKRFAAADGSAMIVPYMGFGTAQRFVVQGRVIKDEGFMAPSETHSAWSNFLELYKRIDSSEVPGAKVTACFRGIEQEAVADDEGYFRIEFKLQRQLDSAGWHQVELRLASPALRHGEGMPARAQVLVPPPSARFGVISDIDDTVLWSNVTNKLGMLKMLAVTNAHTRKPFKGVTAFYSALRDGIAGDEGNPVFYVSSSPWHLYTPLVDFLQAQGIPLGPLMLKSLGMKQLLGRDRHHGHKLENIEKILQTYPGLPFILIGDSGQQDPEIYREVVERHPRRIRAIYIRNVNPDPARIEALDRLIEEVRLTGTQLLLVPDSESAAAHAAAEGLIDPQGMRRVRRDKQDDSGLLGPPG